MAWPELEERRLGDRIKTGVQAFLTPILLGVLGVVLWAQWNNQKAAITTQGAQLNAISGQLQVIQEQIREGQNSYNALESQVVQLQVDDRDHEHRITVLESNHLDPSTGRHFRP